MATLTGVKPGEGWLPVETLSDHPSVVRIHGIDERIGGLRHIGSGFLVGNIENCDIWFPQMRGHAGIPVEALEVCKIPGARDTALLFMRLQTPAQLTVLPIDTQRAPESGDNVLVAGFGLPENLQLPLITGGSGPVPKRVI